MSELVKRTYRVTETHDKKVKQLAKDKSESQVIREAIENLPLKATEARKNKNI